MQELYMSVLLMIGVVLLSITIGSVGDMFENANREKLDLQEKCDSAKLFLKQNKIGGLLEQRIKNYLDYLWIDKDVQTSNVLNTLPFNLRHGFLTLPSNISSIKTILLKKGDCYECSYGNSQTCARFPGL